LHVAGFAVHTKARLTIRFLEMKGSETSVGILVPEVERKCKARLVILGTPVPVVLTPMFLNVWSNISS